MAVPSFFQDFAVRPYVKADSGAFEGDLKMPLLVNQPGRRPGDFCLDDVAGLVRVRRGDQSILNLGLGGATPSWASTVGVANNSGASIVVDGNITMSMASATISTSSGSLILSPASSIVDITGNAGSLQFLGAGDSSIVSAGGALALAPATGLVNVNGNALAFTGGASTISTSGGDLTLAPVSGVVHITGTTPTIANVGLLTLAPTTGIIFVTGAFPTIATSSGDLALTPSTGKVNVNGASAAVPGALTLNNAYLYSVGTAPTCTAVGNIIGGTGGVNIHPNSNSDGGYVTASSIAAGPFSIELTYHAPYSSGDPLPTISPYFDNTFFVGQLTISAFSFTKFTVSGSGLTGISFMYKVMSVA